MAENKETEKTLRDNLRRKLFAKFAELGIDTREDLIFNFTCGRTQSMRKLATWEMGELLDRLGGTQKSSSNDFQWARFDSGNRQHMYLLSLCYQYGWTRYSEKRQQTVADLNRLGRWIRLYSQVKKPLLEQDVRETQKTIYQFEQMVTKYYSRDKHKNS